MNKKEVDVLIVGAGSTGSSIAYESIKRGLKVALIDSGDIGGGTSSRSTKLLHGGVRYLELAAKTLDFSQLKLVKEALKERSHWISEVPFLAKELQLAIPTKNCLERFYYRFGLGIYDILAKEKSIRSSYNASNHELNEIAPSIQNKYDGAVIYSDGQFNDARLNLLFALTAQKGGADLNTRNKLVEFILNPEGKLCGAISEDLNGLRQQWDTKVIVNATGIYVDSVRKIADQDANPRILASRGVHIVLKEQLLPNGKGILLPKTKDGRVVFFLPFHDRTLIGTTDTPCELEAAKSPTKQEKEYLLDYAMQIFPKLKRSSIKSSWAGGRPLVKPVDNTLQKSSRLVREHEIEILPCGLISAMGGKWTTCRNIALDVIKAMEIVLEKNLPVTYDLPILGSQKNSINNLESLTKQRHLLESILPESTVKDKQIDHLESTFGLEASAIISSYKKNQMTPISNVIPICEAELRHYIRNELAITPTDLLARRCRLAMVDMEEANRLLPIVNKILREEGLFAMEIDLTN